MSALYCAKEPVQAVDVVDDTCVTAHGSSVDWNNGEQSTEGSQFVMTSEQDYLAVLSGLGLDIVDMRDGESTPVRAREFGLFAYCGERLVVGLRDGEVYQLHYVDHGGKVHRPWEHSEHLACAAGVVCLGDTLVSVLGESEVAVWSARDEPALRDGTPFVVRGDVARPVAKLLGAWACADGGTLVHFADPEGASYSVVIAQGTAAKPRKLKQPDNALDVQHPDLPNLVVTATAKRISVVERATGRVLCSRDTAEEVGAVRLKRAELYYAEGCAVKRMQFFVE